MNSNSSINRLLKDICIRHACKNVSKYLADIDQAVGIKLKPAENSSLEFTWSKVFEWYSDAVDKRDDILSYFKLQKPKMFSIIDYGLTLGCHYKLSFSFMFHPENAI